MTPDELAAVKARHPILEVFDRIGAEPPTRWSSNGDAMIRCPVPAHEDRTPSCIVHTATDRFKCFGCGAYGDVIDLVQMTLGPKTFRDAVQWLDGGHYDLLSSQHVGVRHPHHDRGGPQLDRTPLDRLLEINALAWQVLSDEPRRHAALRYVRRRGIDIDALEGTVGRPLVGYPPTGRLGLLTELQNRGCTVDEVIDAGWAVNRDDGVVDRLHRRAVFAIRNINDAVTGYTARDITGCARSKYINTPTTAAFVKGSSLYAPFGFPEHCAIVLCEGPLDALALAAAGRCCSSIGVAGVPFAALGTALTTRQANLIAALNPLQVVALADGDAAGRTAVPRWAGALDHAGVKVIAIEGLVDGDPTSWFARCADSLSASGPRFTRTPGQVAF